ncbi:MAG: hypothetical protein ACI854_002030 [Arenicella sp.]|jgi:hypothetical protein
MGISLEIRLMNSLFNGHQSTRDLGFIEYICISIDEMPYNFDEMMLAIKPISGFSTAFVR